jgi:hypothetical protein
MESFAKYYEMPLRVDEYCPFYIWTKDNEMAFNYLDESKLNNEDTSEVISIVNAINGYEPGCFNASIHPEHKDIIQIDGVDKLLIRGWGNLTARGSHNLSTKEACKIQDDFAKWIVEQLSRNLN